ncbi:LysR family transcriptional regulator [Halalkalibacter oceani]|uniref:LysR family transcriptional regulator n=1 Tax=Halalkalibacter oceani TaxID=1653776 RepID=UPI00339477F5
MEWQQLEYFQRVAQLQHVTKAAQSLFISQPALSRSIARLEKELGVPLFERQGRTVQLNRYGKLFLEKVNLAIQVIEEGKQELQSEMSPNRGNITLSFLPTLGTDFVPELIEKYRATYPDVTFQLFQNTAHDLIEQLKAGDIDVCLTTIVEPDPEIQWVELFSEELLVIVPQCHRLSDRQEIRLKDIANEPFVGFKKGAGLRSITDRLCQQSGFTPQLTFEGQEVGTVAGLVGVGLGVSLVPKRSRMDAYQVSCLPVRDVDCRRTIGIVWRKKSFMPKVVEQFRDFIVELYGREEDTKD